MGELALLTELARGSLQPTLAHHCLVAAGGTSLRVLVSELRLHDATETREGIGLVSEYTPIKSPTES